MAWGGTQHAANAVVLPSAACSCVFRSLPVAAPARPWRTCTLPAATHLRALPVSVSAARLWGRPRLRWSDPLDTALQERVKGAEGGAVQRRMEKGTNPTGAVRHCRGAELVRGRASAKSATCAAATYACSPHTLDQRAAFKHVATDDGNGWLGCLSLSCWKVAQMRMGAAAAGVPPAQGSPSTPPSSMRFAFKSTSLPSRRCSSDRVSAHAVSNSCTETEGRAGQGQLAERTRKSGVVWDWDAVGSRGASSAGPHPSLRAAKPGLPNPLCVGTMH